MARRTARSVMPRRSAAWPVLIHCFKSGSTSGFAATGVPVAVVRQVSAASLMATSTASISGSTPRSWIRTSLRGLTYTQVSKRLADGGRSISPLAVRRIEDGERKVDADDLMALALALDVSPTYFLMPGTDGPEDEVSVTGRLEPVDAKKLYDFLHGEHGIEGRPVRVGEWIQHLMATAPLWRIDEAESALHTLSDLRLADEWRGQESEIPGFKRGND